MKSKSAISRFVAWLASPEVFGSIVKKIPGEWILFEYYFDEGKELVHKVEKDIKQSDESLQLRLNSEEKFSLNSKLTVSVFDQLQKGGWSVHRNYITLIDSSDFRNNLEFQFAFEKENLKLLKKDKFGNIEFFGFFRSANTPQNSK